MRHVVMVGLMASGKTSVGSAIADALAWPLRDSDRDLRAATGRSARQIAAEDGIKALHDLERDHLLAGLADPAPSVICAAASVIDEPVVRDALRDPSVMVVWLRVSAESVARRMTSTDHRPRPEAIEAQAARRDPWFATVANAIIDSDVAAEGGASAVADVVATVRQRVDQSR